MHWLKDLLVCGGSSSCDGEKDLSHYALYFSAMNYYDDERLVEGLREQLRNRPDMPPSTCSRGRELARGEPAGGVATTPPVASSGVPGASGAGHDPVLRNRAARV